MGSWNPPAGPPEIHMYCIIICVSAEDYEKLEQKVNTSYLSRLDYQTTHLDGQLVNNSLSKRAPKTII